MDNFKIVLIILAIFLVYCYLKNNGYFKEDITIFEGADPAAVVPERGGSGGAAFASRDTITQPTAASALNSARDASTYGANNLARNDTGGPMSPQEQAAAVATANTNTGGATNINNTYTSSRPGGGLCRDSSGVELPGDWDQSSCTGMTGYSLSWKTKEERRAFFDATLTGLPQNIKDKELAIEPTDVLSNNTTGANKYQYRDTASGAITQPYEKVPLIPWNDEPYCLAKPSGSSWASGGLTGSMVQSGLNTKETCVSGGFKWIVPNVATLLDNDYSDLRKDRCGISVTAPSPGPGDGQSNPGEPDCKAKDSLYMPHCESSDGLEIMPKNWWKNRWRSGLTFQELCEGKSTTNTWQGDQDLADLMDGKVLDYMAARHGSSISSSQSQDDLNATIQLRNVVVSDLAAQATTSAEARAQLAAIQTDAESQRRITCSLETDNDGITYLGNIDDSCSQGLSCPAGTAGGYIFEDNNAALNATNLEELNQKSDGSRNRMSCNPVNFQSDPNFPNNPTVRCVNNQFNFDGCIPKTCKMPLAAAPGNDGWHPELYEFIDNTRPGMPGFDPATGAQSQDAVDINSFVDTRTGSLKIRCAQGPTTTDINRPYASLAPGFDNIQVSCGGANGDISIQGCIPNKCYTPSNRSDTGGGMYYINKNYDQSSGESTVDGMTFKNANHWAQSSSQMPSGSIAGDNDELGHRWPSTCGVNNITGIPEANDTPLVRPTDTHNTITMATDTASYSNTYKQPCFSCKAPNYYKINDNVGDTPDDITARNNSWVAAYAEENNVMKPSSIQVSNGVDELYDYGAQAKCLQNETDFTLSGCYENKCMNPDPINGIKKVYDSERRHNNSYTDPLEPPEWVLKKPVHMEDTLNLSTDNPSNDITGHYQKYSMKQGATLETSKVTKAESHDKFQCGTNFSSTSVNSTDKVISPDSVKCYNFFDYRNKGDVNNKDVPNYYQGTQFNESPGLLLTPANIGTDPLINTQPYNYLSLSGCEDNYCKWPRYPAPATIGTSTFDIPRNRKASFPAGQLGDNTNSISEGTTIYDGDPDTGERGVLGYFVGSPSDRVDSPADQEKMITHHDHNSKKSGYEYSDTNVKGDTSIHTAREWANIDRTGIYRPKEEADGTTNTDNSLTCIGSGELGSASNQCVAGVNGNREPTWLNSEIDTMVSEAGLSTGFAANMTHHKGQPVKMNDNQVISQMTSSDLDRVGRGGPFTISRCWKRSDESVNPLITCSRSDGSCGGLRDSMNETINKSTCDSATVTGCEQKTCKLSEVNALGGMRILVETAQGTYKSIGGPQKDNMSSDILFNVDQIRQITCDYNHSKVVPQDDFGDVICATQGGDISVGNICSQTTCGSGTDPANYDIVDTQHISKPGYVSNTTDNKIGGTSSESTQFSRGPGIEWGSTRVAAWDPIGSSSSPLATLTTAEIQDEGRPVDSMEYSLGNDQNSTYINDFPVGDSCTATDVQADPPTDCSGFTGGVNSCPTGCTYNQSGNTFQGRYDIGLTSPNHPLLNIAWGDKYAAPSDGRSEEIHNYDLLNYDISTLSWTQLTSGEGPLAPTIECAKGSDISSSPDYLNTLPVGGSKTNPTAVASCNYSATDIDSAKTNSQVPSDPKYKISHCQRKTCEYPNLDSATILDGYRYTNNRAIPLSTDSVNNVLGLEYGAQTDGTSGGGDVNTLYGAATDSQKQIMNDMTITDIHGNDVPRFRPDVPYAPYADAHTSAEGLSQNSINNWFGGALASDTLTQNTNNPGYRNKVGASIQCDNRNWYGTPSASCSQTSSEYLTNTSPPFSFQGCNETTCVVPRAGASTGGVSKNMYDALSYDEKEKWDRVERGYIWPQLTDLSAPTKTSELRDNSSTDDSSSMNIQCNINYRRNSATDFNVRCPSYQADGLLPQYDDNGSAGLHDQVFGTRSDEELATEQFGFFTNIYSSKPLGSLTEQIPLSSSGSCSNTGMTTEVECNGDPAATWTPGSNTKSHTGVPYEPIDKPFCVENKCRLSPMNECSMSAYGGIAGTGCDDKYDLRNPAAGEYNNTLKSNPELPGYEFNVYVDATATSPPDSLQVGTKVVLMHNDTTVSTTTSAGNHNESISGSAGQGRAEQYPTRIQEAIDTPKTVHQMGGNAGLRCAQNYHSRGGETPSITCGAETSGQIAGRTDRANYLQQHTDSTAEFALSGCYENYCRLPLDNVGDTSKYSYTHDNKSNLENLQQAQAGTLTLRQFNNSSDLNTLKCAPWTQPSGGFCAPGDSDLTSAHALTAADQVACTTAGGTWTPFTGPKVTCPTHEGTFRFEGCEPMTMDSAAVGSFYYAAFPGDCIGFWPGSLSHISGDGTTAIAPQAATDSKLEMYKFMNTCETNCNNNSLCSGFTVQKVGAGSATADTPEGTMVCNQKTSLSVPQPLAADNTTVTPLPGPTDSQCLKSEETEGYWAENWGYDQLYEDYNLIDTGLLNDAGQTALSMNVEVVRHEYIPDDQPIYFEKKQTPAGSTGR